MTSDRFKDGVDEKGIISYNWATDNGLLVILSNNPYLKSEPVI